MCAADTPPVSARERFGHDIIVSDRAPSNRGTPMIDRNSRACALGRPGWAANRAVWSEA